MTIIAGFKCKDGVVLCADTQETIAHLSKRNVPKLRFEPSGVGARAGQLLMGVDLAVAFCGAADNGPFIDKLVDHAWEAAQSATSLDEVCTEMENSIKESQGVRGQSPPASQQLR